MKKQFNPTRLKLARTRRQMTLKSLAEKVGLTTKSVSTYEKEYCEYSPKDTTIEAYAKALNYPAEFLLMEDDVEDVSSETVSFRSLKSMKASQHHAAIGVGSLGLMLNDYFIKKFPNLPNVDLPDLRSEAPSISPEVAARLLREQWDLGNQSISNVIHLLEKHGVRVFSLSENTQSVDAFSFWKDDIPFVYLNTQKSGERSRFDAAHELGHLVLHRHGIPQGKDIEAEADRFASYFLMPKPTVLAHKSIHLTVDNIIKLKANWKVSAMALIVQMKNVGAISEWQYRNLIIEASKLGLRRKEIDGIENEVSGLIKKLLDTLEIRDGLTIRDIASELNLPLEEVTNLVFKVGVIEGGKQASITKKKPVMKLVQ